MTISQVYEILYKRLLEAERERTPFCTEYQWCRLSSHIEALQLVLDDLEEAEDKETTQ